MKLSAQVTLCFALLPFVAQALPAAGSASASKDASAASSKVDQASNNSKQDAAATNNNNNDQQTTADNNAATNATDIQAAQDANANHKPSDQQILNAVMSWMNDTGKVTNFLNTATSFSGDEFNRQATIALNAEIDELNHKKVLDDALLAQDPNVQAANDVLATQGTFQKVVDVLQSMVDNGPDNAQAQVNEINQNRCVNVLPNIDQYFAAAGNPEVSAARPTGCLEITSTGTVGVQAQGTGDVAAQSVNSAASSSVTDAASSSSAEATADATSSNDATGATAADAAGATATDAAEATDKATQTAGDKATGNEGASDKTAGNKDTGAETRKGKNAADDQ